MSDIESLAEVFNNPDTLSSIADQLGTDTDTARQAIAAALPAVVGGLGEQASDPGSAASLTSAIERDHDGSLLDSVDMLGSLLNGTGTGKAFDGAGILGHIFGDQQSDVANQLASKTGQSSSMFSKLLPILAPIVMSWLAKKMSGGGSSQTQGQTQSQASGGGVADILGSVLGGLGGGSSSSGGGLADILGSLLGGSK